MRVGDNPNKFSENNIQHYAHQVIIPVYIPNEEGYFKDSFAIFRLCMQSLLATTHSDTYITIVNNGSGKKVADYLNGLAEENKIQELIHTTNIGKINAVLKGIVGVHADIVTVSDQDILFKENWQSATFEVFNSFENVGVVGIIPMFNTFKSYSYNTIFDYLFSSKLKFSEVKNPDDMVKFYDSIWIERNYHQFFLKKHLSLCSSNRVVAVIGSGHVVASYRKSVFNSLEFSYAKDLLSGNSDGAFLDLPPLKLGYYRLTTQDNYAYHMGNSYEEWMTNQVKFDIIKPSQVCLDKSIYKEKHKFYLGISYYLKYFFIKKVVFNKVIFKLFLKLKGLDQEFIKTF